MFLKMSLNRVRDTRDRLKDYRLESVDWDLKMMEMEKLQNHGCCEGFIERWKGE